MKSVEILEQIRTFKNRGGRGKLTVDSGYSLMPIARGGQAIFIGVNPPLLHPLLEVVQRTV